MKAHFDALDPNRANHVALSPISFLKRAARIHATQTATVQGDTRRTWAEVESRIRRVAAGLIARGIGPGDTVTAIAPKIAPARAIRSITESCAEHSSVLPCR